MSDSVAVQQIVQKASEGLFLDHKEMIHLLGVDDAGAEVLFRAAREVRDKSFNKKIFMYGFVYFSTYCRNNCAFCFYRKSNDESIRYSKEPAEIIETAVRLKKAGIHLVDLTMGEDPYYINDMDGFSRLEKIICDVKAATGLPVMISPGVLNEAMLLRLRQIGVEWYACYQETHNREVFKKLRLGQSYDQRIEAKKNAKEIGFLTEEGLLAGVGETDADIADSMFAMRELQVDQVRVMSFVPQKGTTMQDWLTPERKKELRIIALMRLLFPDRLIPASLDVDGLAGLQPRLEAGANVVTSIIPPLEGFAGVSQNTLDIDEGNRTVESAADIIKQCGLLTATSADYQAWVKERLALSARL
jgi:methylornithine synthase